jgi:hypothetical protein
MDVASWRIHREDTETSKRLAEIITRAAVQEGVKVSPRGDWSSKCDCGHHEQVTWFIILPRRLS